MFITHPTWQAEGVARALLAPAIPWRSALLDVWQPCFLVSPQVVSAIPQTHVRLFSDIDELLIYIREERARSRMVYALSFLNDALSVTVVTAIGSYPCPQTGIKLRVYFDDHGHAWPAHSGQPQFSMQLAFDVEENFASSE